MNYQKYEAIKMEAGEDKIQFWVLLGPIFIISSLFLTIFHNDIFNFDTWFFSLLGILLLWKFKNKGLLVAITFYSMSVCVKHLYLQSHHIWQLGLELTVLLGFIITAFSFEQSKLFLEKIFSKNDETKRKIEALNEELEKEKDFHSRQEKSLRSELEEYYWKAEDNKKEILSMQSLVNTLRKNVDEQKENRELLLFEIEKNEKKICSLLREKDEIEKEIISLNDSKQLKENNKRLLEELNKSRIEKQQTHYINEALAKHISNKPSSDNGLQEKLNILKDKYKNAVNKINELNKNIETLSKNKDEKIKVSSSLEQFKNLSDKEKLETLKNYQMKVKSLQNIESLHKQLRSQFEEKNISLNKTRSQVFKLQEELLAIKNHNKNSRFNVSEQEVVLSKKLSEAEEELNILQKENKQLQDLISSLNNK